MADRTGLEPATSGVTGRHSNQLNYRSAMRGNIFKREIITLNNNKLTRLFPSVFTKWWVMTGSNRRPSACKADALPAELITPFVRDAHSTDIPFAVKHLRPFFFKKMSHQLKVINAKQKHQKIGSSGK